MYADLHGLASALAGWTARRRVWHYGSFRAAWVRSRAAGPLCAPHGTRDTTHGTVRTTWMSRRSSHGPQPSSARLARRRHWLGKGGGLWQCCRASESAFAMQNRLCYTPVCPCMSAPELGRRLCPRAWDGRMAPLRQLAHRRARTCTCTCCSFSPLTHSLCFLPNEGLFELLLHVLLRCDGSVLGRSTVATLG